MQHTTQTISIFAQHAAPVEHNGVVRHFRTTEGADRFLALVGKLSTVRDERTVGTTRAQDVHKPAQRIGDRPECIRRLDVKAALTVISTPPPDGTRPTPALRIVGAADERAAA
jgi:hypothetical protein